MEIKTVYESDCDTRIYASDSNWYCGLENNERVQLGVYGCVINTAEYGAENAPEGFPFLCQFNIVAHDPAINDDALRSVGADRDYFVPYENDPEAQAEVMREMLQEYGGANVPVDDLLVHGIHKPGENALMALLEGLKYKLVENTHWATGERREIPWFDSWEDAETFVKRALERADTLMALVGFTLDRPVNMIGADGWSIIRSQVEGKTWDPWPKRA